LFADLKLTGDQSIEFDGQKLNSKAFLRQHILQTSANFGADGEWAFLLNVEVLGKREGKPIRTISNTSHPGNTEWGNTATARMTGIPASIGAQKLAGGEARRKGVFAPDVCFDPMSFFAELAKRGIQVVLS
jgi:saccharopine dehydrogenase-like NADP-dependent oxidoreductase